MLTLKIKYETENKVRILEYIKNYNSIFNSLFNFLQKQDRKLSTKESFEFIRKLKNVFIAVGLQNGALYDARSELARVKDKKVIFGGRKLFLQRLQNKISKEDFRVKKLRPLLAVGAKINKGNPKFQILSENQILFKPCKAEHFVLDLKSVGKNYQKYLKALILCQENKEIPITYKLDTDHVYVLFDESKVIPKFKELKVTNKLKNRVFAIDLNPNYIGWSVVDWKSENIHKTIKSGAISIKDLNDYENSLNVSSDSPEKKYIINKRKYETIQIGYELTKIANHYRCSTFGIEDLNIKSSDKEKGKNFNRLVNNQWNRNLLINILNKLCNLYQIHFQKIQANFSSFQGNLIYRQERLPDPCLSSIEIGRRAYEFYHQYILKDKEKTKNIIFDKLENAKSRVIQSLEELNYSVAFENLSELYYTLKKRKCQYRFPLKDSLSLRRFSSTKHSKSFCTFIVFD